MSAGGTQVGGSHDGVAHGYHVGEVRAQERAGVRQLARRRERILQAALPEVARRFLAERRAVVLGAADEQGRVWASILNGAPGFVQVRDPRTVRIAATPTAGDPLAGALRPSGLVGMIAMDLERRMRVRVNGLLSRDPAGSLLIYTHQVYANCPKYIQTRRVEGDVDDGTAVPPTRSGGLTEEQRAWIRRADTFFVATLNPEVGADASHRGGMPGFVAVEEDRLTWPDYAGNAMFGTLGNLEVHPQAGLLFVDFERGSTLQLTGQARVDWDPDRAAAVPGAERLVHFDVEEAVEIHGALPFRLRLQEYSPFNPQ